MFDRWYTDLADYLALTSETCLMLTTFEVYGFRLFGRLVLPQLGRVNLLVGRNNSGKSAFLEAMEIYTNKGSARSLLSLISARQETWEAKAQVEFRHLYGNPIRHIFRGHRLPKLGEAGIRLGPTLGEGAPIRIFVAAYKTSYDPELETFRRERIKPDDVEGLEGEIELSLVVEESGRERRIMSLERGSELMRRHSISQDLEVTCPIQVVPTRNMEVDKTASLWDAIGLTELRKEVISGLRLIEPINDLQFVQSTVSPRERLPLVTTDMSKEPLPLRSMGDGTNRLFNIVLALASASDGVLLVDEFENGLHWSVQKEVWKTVFRLASRLNVQVFATTHSRDCVHGFGQAWRENEGLGAFFRLYVADHGEVEARPYQLELLADSLETDVEVR